MGSFQRPLPGSIHRPVTHYGADDFADAGKLARSLGRERVKDTTLDYGVGMGTGQGQAVDLEAAVRRYAERRGLDALRPESAIVVRAERKAPIATPKLEQPVSASVSSAKLAEDVAQGKARFLERFGAHRQQKAQRAADEATAGELVGQWDRLITDFKATLPRLDVDPAHGSTREALLGFGQTVREQPGAVGILRQQGQAFGMEKQPILARVLADARPEHVVSEIVEKIEAGMRARLQEQAAKAEVLRQELAMRPDFAPRRGPSMGM